MSQVMSALAAERIKLVSTRAPWLAVTTAAALSMALAALQSWGSGMATMTSEDAADGVAMIGVPILMVVASMTITSEFRTQMIRTTFLVVPNRYLVLGAKAVVSAVVAALAAAIMVLASVVVAGLAAPPLSSDALSLADPRPWLVAGAFSVYAAVAAVFGVGVGALIRAAPGTVVLLLLWPLVIETMLAVLPDVGAQVGPFLPFVNGVAFTGVEPLHLGFDLRWGELGGLLYFTAVTAVVFAAASVVVNRRDP
ncbi:ABC transporter permease [Mycobacterium sp. MS1601]|uniref:ABC transporter permease n=1 Tax=Mycobacterium sp. MS1601 TaxID=1936029 RepID=UPI001F469D24|nr:ABC transporter permease [Mycobacterium sp. MS1601]